MASSTASTATPAPRACTWRGRDTRRLEPDSGRPREYAGSFSFRDHYRDLRDRQIEAVYGLSVQSTDYQREARDRLHLPFDLPSDSGLAGIPLLKTGGWGSTRPSENSQARDSARLEVYGDG